MLEEWPDVCVVFLRYRESFGSWFIDSAMTRFLELEPMCESPIERIMLAILIPQEMNRYAVHSCEFRAPPVIVPQHNILNYRVDFALIGGANDLRIAVECDGHDFHERTKEQARRDRSRDRALSAAGWTVLRFTGREIYHHRPRIYADLHAVMSAACGKPLKPETQVRLAREADARCDGNKGVSA